MEIDMQKFIDAYRKDPSDMNALKLAHHAKMHPGATALLTNPEADILTKARAQLAPFVAKLNAMVIGEFI
jgi:hypothetical protein